MPHLRPDHKRLDLPLPPLTLERLNALCKSLGTSRLDYLINTITDSVNGASPHMDRANYTRACTAVMKATNGKLRRQECEHVVALTIKEMAQ